MQQFTPTIPAAGPFNNTDLNALGSKYAELFGHGTNSDIQRQIEFLIYDAAPKGYFTDLQILKQKPRVKWNSDEKTYKEKVFGRRPLIATANVAGSVQTQVIPVTAISTKSVTINTLITYPNNQKGNVTAVDSSLNTITVSAQSGALLPAVTANDSFAVLSPVVGDGRSVIDTYSRLETIERFNFIQQFARAFRFSQTEMYKYQNSATTNYLQSNKEEVLSQYRIDLSNAFWNGDRGEVILSDGTPAKTMGGVVPTLFGAGSPTTSTTLATLTDAVEDIALSTEFGDSGYRKFLYATPRMILALSQQYKKEKTRYTPDNMLAKLQLEEIDLGSTKIVLVPMKRFEETSCFPASFRNRLVLLDNMNITCAEMWGETIVDETPDIRSGINQNRFKDFYIDGQLSIEMPNPLSSGIVDVA